MYRFSANSDCYTCLAIERTSLQHPSDFSIWLAGCSLQFTSFGKEGPASGKHWPEASAQATVNGLVNLGLLPLVVLTVK